MRLTAGPPRLASPPRQDYYRATWQLRKDEPISAEMFVILDGLMGFGVPVPFCLRELHLLKEMKQQRAAASETPAA